jgi:hypothetical protein
MTTKPNLKLVKSVGILVIIMVVVGRLLGDRMNHDQMLGCLFVGSFLILFSFLAFLLGAIPFRALGAADRVIRWAFVFACFALAYSVAQIPLWCLMTHRFPPATLSSNQATWATIGVILSLFGPAAPLVIRIGRGIGTRDKEQRATLRRKNEDEDRPRA